MSKCGKGCMPECEYFTTSGCISPFNCPYKIETGYINSATSIPTYMEQYNGMSDDDIELCLERLSTCKTTDVMNFDYAGTLAYIKRLKSENAALRERLDKTIELPCKVGDTIYEAAYSGCIQEWIVTDISYKNYGQVYEFRMNCESKNDSKSCRPFIKRTHWNDFEGIGRARFTRVAAEARLKELQKGREE